MTKADIVDCLTEKTGLTKKESTELVELLFDTIKTTLEAGENLK